MKAHAEQTFKCTLELDADEAVVVRTALELLSGEAYKNRLHVPMEKTAKVLYEQLADELNEGNWRE